MPEWLNAIKSHAARMDAQAARPRWATVTSFDPDTHSARLRIEPEGIDVGWTPVSAVSVGAGIGMVAPPAQGDQVLVEPVEGSGSGWAVMGRFFSTKNAPPVSPATEKAVQPNEIALVSSGAIVHLVEDTVHIHAANIRSKGKWEHDGDLEATGDVKAGSVSLKNHRHQGGPPPDQ